jgi:hypothetical protein
LNDQVNSPITFTYQLNKVKFQNLKSFVERESITGQPPEFTYYFKQNIARQLNEIEQRDNLDQKHERVKPFYFEYEKILSKKFQARIDKIKGRPKLDNGQETDKYLDNQLLSIQERLFLKYKELISIEKLYQSIRYEIETPIIPISDREKEIDNYIEEIRRYFNISSIVYRAEGVKLDEQELRAILKLKSVKGKILNEEDFVSFLTGEPIFNPIKSTLTGSALHTILKFAVSNVKKHIKCFFDETKNKQYPNSRNNDAALEKEIKEKLNQ